MEELHHLWEGLLCDTNHDDATNCSCRFPGKDADEPCMIMDYSENNVNGEEVQQQQSLVKVEDHPAEEEGMIKKNHLHKPLTESETAPLSAVTPKKRMRRSRERGPKFVFRTRSEKEVMEDGYKWRKYGKKPVKGSPFPRNYYRCLESSCTVRKRIERDPMDGSIVITTYEGTHNHERPCVVYYCLTELEIR